jgi:hypothetical protein
MTLASSTPTIMTTYCGLVDDFAKRHDDASIQTLLELNEHLISAVLVGHPLLINDGHIIMHPAIREAIVTPAASPLQNLIEAGYIKILSRNKGQLENLADQMAQEGITSAQQFGIEDYYKQRYLPALQKCMSSLRRQEDEVFLRPWPELNTSTIFRKVSATVYDSINDSLLGPDRRTELDSLHRFKDKYESGRHHRRTDWEDTAGVLRDKGKLPENLYRDLMHAANEAYQYSWGCALANGSSLVRVQTRAPKYLDLDLGTSVGETESSMQDTIQIFAPDFRVSHRKIGDNWDRLAALTRPGEPTYQAKVEFQRSLERYYRTNGTEVSKASMDAVASEYSKALTEHFRSERRVRLVYGCAAAVGGAGVGLIAAPLGVLLAAGVGLAFAVATVTADVAGAPNALIKIAQRNGKKWITSEPLGARPTMISTFQIDQAAANTYRHGVRTFKPS